MPLVHLKSGELIFLKGINIELNLIKGKIALQKMALVQTNFIQNNTKRLGKFQALLCINNI